MATISVSVPAVPVDVALSETDIQATVQSSSPIIASVTDTEIVTTIQQTIYEVDVSQNGIQATVGAPVPINVTVSAQQGPAGAFLSGTGSPPSPVGLPDGTMYFKYT